MENFNEKKTQFWLNLAHFTNDIYTGMLSPVMPFIAAKLSFSMAVATVVLSVSHICTSLLQPAFGFFADNLRKRTFVFWGLLMSSLFIPFAPRALSVCSLILFVVLGSLGSSFFHPQALGFTIKFSKSDVAKNMGLFMCFGTVGFALGPVISAGITQFFGLDKISYLSVLGVCVAFSMFFFVPKIKEERVTKTHTEFFETFKEILSNRKVNLLNLIAMLKTLVTTSSCILLPFLWKNLGHSAFYIGFALFAYNFMGGLGAFISRKIELKLGTERVFYLSMMTSFPMMATFMITYKTYPIVALCTFILMGLIQWMAVPVTMVMAQSVLPQYKSIIGGFINGFSWGVVAIVMTFVGYVAQAKGIMPVLLVVSAIPATLSYPVVKRLFRLMAKED